MSGGQAAVAALQAEEVELVFGLIGSATKWARFRSRLVQKGHLLAAIDRIRCPIGTPALGKEPGIIAVGAAHALLMEVAKKEAISPVAG